MTLEELKKRCEQYNDCPSSTVLKLLEIVVLYKAGLTEILRDCDCLIHVAGAIATLDDAAEIERSL